MTSFADERMLRMPGLSIAGIIGLAEGILETVYPKSLEAPIALPVLEIFEEILPQFGIETYAASEGELQEEEALTHPNVDPVQILLREEFFADLESGDGRAFRPRATLAHELGHAVMHVPVVRRRLRYAKALPALLPRVERRREIPVYQQSEWQAWTFAKAFLMPPRMIRQMEQVTDAILSDTFAVSEPFAASWIRQATAKGFLGDRVSEVEQSIGRRSGGR